ncbi:MAG TPA: HAMP domain-containing sensor histidine kinase [Polyangia bacterium]|nr:HAMP domain-containing sensor histidine kinase [Polyangia bacterium]
MVASSALSYRDAKVAGAVVAERHGIEFFHRLERLLGRGPNRPDPTSILPSALEANRSLGLTYVGLYDQGKLVAEAGEPLLAQSKPSAGAPSFGRGRVRMVRPARSRPPFPDHDRRFGESLAPGAEGPSSPFEHRRPAPEGWRPPGPAPPSHELIVEFIPIGSEDARRRALTVLLLSCGAAGLLTIAALVLWSRSRRAEQVEAHHAAQHHLAQLGEMSAVLAHEIRNPLAALKGHAQLLAEKVQDAGLKTRVDRVVTEAVRLEQLTNDLLDFARSGTIHVAPVEPSELLVRAVAAAATDRIAVTSRSAPPTWRLDAARIEQVLFNLLDNALAVTPAALMVDAQVTREGDALVYSFRDRGPGVPEAERTRVFEPFHTTKLRGTGLGLAVAKRIVQLHGGRIDVVDALGGGAVFRVYIPG